VPGRERDDDKRQTIQRLYRQGFTVLECAEKTYSSPVPALDEDGEPLQYLLNQGRFGDPTSYAKAVARWNNWVRRVAKWCEEAQTT
jgi:hypothetical protein